jgi:hypothetical protein
VKKKRLQPDRCPTSGKIKFLDQAEAAEAASRRAEKTNLTQLNIYQCSHCGFWHLTSRTP